MESLTATIIPSDTTKNQAVALPKSTLDTARDAIESLRNEGETLMMKYYNSYGALEHEVGEYVEFAEKFGEGIAHYAEQSSGISHADIQSKVEGIIEYDAEAKELADKADLNTSEGRKELRLALEEITAKKRIAQEEVEEDLGKMRHGYIDGLRVASGEDLGVGDEGLALSESAKATEKRAGAKLESMLDCYPRSWIEESNTLPDLLPRESTARANYMSKFKIRVQTEDKVFDYGNFSETGVMFEDRLHEYVPLSEEEKDEYIKNSSYWDDTVDSRDNLYKQYKWTTYDPKKHGELQENGLPKGKNWEKRIKRAKRLTEDLAIEIYEEELIMRRGSVVKEAPRETGEVAARITFPPSKKDQLVSNTAIHEFMHRSEQMNNMLPTLERGFLYSRKGENERLSRIGDGATRKEIGYADSFAHAYTGKIYQDRFNRDNEKYYEILSTGVEDLLGSHQPCPSTSRRFTWHKDGKNDTQLRNFVLGTMAFSKPRSYMKNKTQK